MKGNRIWSQSRLPILRSHLDYVETIWLFTRSDMKTIIFPQSIFGAATAHTACVLHQAAVPGSIFDTLLFHFPVALCWTWLNLIPFNILNQLSEEAVQEDRMNKPWRPLPSGKISRPEAKHLMLKHYVVAVAVSSHIGGLRQSLLLIVLGFWYNVAGGADRSFIVRNFINAGGFLSFASGALEVAMESPLSVTEPLVQWLGLLGFVIFATVQVQDLYDVAGDFSRNRQTMPLVLGDSVTRCWTAILVAILSYACPAYWALDWHAFLLPASLGIAVSVRTLSLRSVAADEMTFRIWNVWLVSIYLMPCVKYVYHGCT